MDPISTISGPVSAASFVDGSATATGAAVVAELGQLINKVNEVVEGLTVVADDLDAGENVFAVVPDHTAAIADHETRIGVLEDSAAVYGVTGYTLVDRTLSVADIRAWRTLVCAKYGTDIETEITLPCVGIASSLVGVGPIKIVADKLLTVRILLQTAGVWADGSLDTYYLELAAGEWCEVLPYASSTTPADVVWFLVGGKTYSDLTT